MQNSKPYPNEQETSCADPPDDFSDIENIAVSIINGLATLGDGSSENDIYTSCESHLATIPTNRPPPAPAYLYDPNGIILAKPPPPFIRDQSVERDGNEVRQDMLQDDGFLFGTKDYRGANCNVLSETIVSV